MESTQIDLQPTQYGQFTGALGNENVDKQAFLNLLVTQLKNQDPLAPTANEAFLAQLATFSQLEEAQNSNALLGNLVALNEANLSLGGLSQGANLVGRDVDYLDPITGEIQSGNVSSVTFSPTGVQVEINGQAVPAGNIISIRAGGATPSLTTSTGSAPPATATTGSTTPTPTPAQSPVDNIASLLESLTH
jgi:flagellar basal-body rod modification protein FlgD